MPGVSAVIRGKSLKRRKRVNLNEEFLFRDLYEHDSNFKYEKSTASCKMDEITGFVFGGLTSRFWIHRKHINLLDEQKAKYQSPFFSWECLTLQMGYDEVNLVIKNEHHM